MTQPYNAGLDIGSTTAKLVILNVKDSSRLCFQRYERHQAHISACLGRFLADLQRQMGDIPINLHVTGSVGMGLAEKCGLPFVQEVVAAGNCIRLRHPEVSTLIDIGGEDAKVVFFSGGRATDLRMNGNCAGGTGAFIDQMAILLGVTVDELSDLALHASRTYPIASRCGVFCKTDIQNLVAKNISREDIAASIFHAVAVQTVITLAHGCSITPPVMLCGGPLAFIPALRKAFADYLHLDETDLLLPADAALTPALGTAIDASEGRTMQLSELLGLINNRLDDLASHPSLPPLFASDEAHRQWRQQKQRCSVERASLPAGLQRAVVGIDSGSTTTKMVVMDEQGRMLFSYYHDNEGNPIQAVERGLKALENLCRENHTDLRIVGSCSTGYGEDLIRAAFHLDDGIVETMAHYLAARRVNPHVSFILDIGGQDMKAIFVREGGVISRIEINEACSSGCGSFISTFARSLDYDVARFAQAACQAQAPCDLGTRCTVFMNSKVKQVLREGATVPDIAAGLSYSVVKNCLYKVLQLKDSVALGDCIVVQGGTMRNDAIVRALEKLTGKDVSRSDCPELMGALGCALYVREHLSDANAGRTLPDVIASAQFSSKMLNCHGCANQCAVSRYTFAGGNHYYSGNRCEKVFSNQGASARGVNAYEEKLRLLFDRIGTGVEASGDGLCLGIPRCLNMYEEFPFWHALFTRCGIRVRLSGESTFGAYEQTAGLMMSDNICFPAKLVHSHICDLARQQVDRIFMPFVVYEPIDSRQQNSYNCPIVSGYSQVVKSVQTDVPPIDSPDINFKDKTLLYAQCREYLLGLGVLEQDIKAAFHQALDAQSRFVSDLAAYNRHIVDEAVKARRLVLLLAGRPYHSDPLIQHKAAHMIASLGVDVITDDIVRGEDISLEGVNFLPQWAYTNRILKAACWVGERDEWVQYVQFTSFGCGPDAFLTDAVRDQLKARGKNLTLLKIDDVNNIGSLRLRVRSLVESLRIDLHDAGHEVATVRALPPYTRKDRKKKIIVPFFTPFLSPLIPALMKVAGYDVDCLPMSDGQSSDWGLKYSNNEVCYPATLIVGDIVKAFRTGRYDPDKTCVAITQTGGQCRASNYISLIKKALVENGYWHTPVVAVALGSGINNTQPGFKINWLRVLPVALAAILYGDCIAKFYYAAAPREQQPGQAARLRDWYLEAARPLILKRRINDLYSHLALAAKEFNRICRPADCPRVGIVGEIFLKFHPFAQQHVTDWLIRRGIEVMPPLLSDFFLQSFVSLKVNQAQHLQRKRVPDFLVRRVFRRVQRQLERVNQAGSEFAYFVPFDNIFEKAEKASRIISLTSQFGEGWLIAGEMATLAEAGVSHVVSLQPFGCIANHIVEKGIEKRIKSLYPNLNILSLDFDSSVSEVNITNRLLLFIDNLNIPKL